MSCGALCALRRLTVFIHLKTGVKIEYGADCACMYVSAPLAALTRRVFPYTRLQFALEQIANQCTVY